MTSFLSRYQDGEHTEVWAELLALGAQIREEPLYSDALAVARETMRRVRYNIELLIPRLIELGYQFGYGWVTEQQGMMLIWSPRWRGWKPSGPQRLGGRHHQMCRSILRTWSN